MQRVCSLVIAVLLILSTTLGYLYHGERNDVENAKGGIFQASTMAIFCLSDMAALETMLENNVSDDVLRERLSRYTYCAWELSGASFSLYELTGENKYWNLYVAGGNLESYFSTAVNSPDPREKVSKDVRIFNELSEELSSILQNGGVENLTDAEAERLFNLAQSLSG
ncbi:hypothetical protein E3E23_07440 [Thermococcus sp. CX2]|uniref:hypothetical protein n=1 Tax=unclassified Thermococcus TaxID=2627626 RepID=UPI00143099D6|nr:MULTISPECIES: hypothetical protein [unclassified Thermococcus]NJE41638.1 hypothetical protein [Thermococcus sp. GR6]NJE85654.1 hypothetical protein [Thermococcus sp. CX2]